MAIVIFTFPDEKCQIMYSFHTGSQNQKEHLHSSSLKMNADRHVYIATVFTVVYFLGRTLMNTNIEHFYDCEFFLNGVEFKTLED